MSSTKRGGVRKVSDYYVTPVPAILDFLRAWEKVDPEASRVLEGQILDPAAGGDDRRMMSYPEALRIRSCVGKILTLDIRKDSLAFTHEDYLAWAPDREVDLVITNPPFTLAKEFVEKALSHVRRGGRVVMLLRLNFLGSLGRRSFWQDRMPRFLFVHAERMSFTDDGCTDSIEYMHAVWAAGEARDHAEIRVI